jgi:O-antigen/teichoic acid export membrane protein
MSEEQKFQSELKNVAKYTGISLIGIVFFNLMGYINNIIITRNVDPEFFGLFVLSVRIVSYLALISYFGLHVGTTKFISQYFSLSQHAKVKSIFFFSLKFVAISSLTLSTIVFIFSPLISTRIFNKPELSPILRLMLILVPFASVGGVFLLSLRGLKLIKHQVLTSKIIEPFARCVFLLLFFYFGYKTFGIIWTQIIIVFFTFVISGYFVYSKYLRFHKDTPLTSVGKELITFSFPLYWDSFLNNTRLLLPIYIMGIFLSGTDIGIFHICSKIATLIAIPLMALDLIFGPTLSGLFARNEKKVLERLFKTTTKWIFTISLGAFFFILIYAEPILSIFGTEYATGTNILTVQIVGILFSISVGSNGQLIVMSGRSKLTLVNSIFTFIIMGVLAIALIPKYGALGAAIATAITSIIMSIVRFIQVLVLEKIHPYKLSYIKPILAGVSTFFIVQYYASSVSLSKAFNLISGILIFSIIFCLILSVLRFDEEDKIILKAIKQKLNR